MLVEGVLTEIGSGNTGPAGWVHVGHLGFQDQEDLRSSKRKISLTPYMADKLSSSIGKKIKISLTPGTMVVVAFSDGQQAYRLDNEQLGTARNLSKNLNAHLIDFLLIGLLFTGGGALISIPAWFWLRAKRKRDLKEMAALI